MLLTRASEYALLSLEKIRRSSVPIGSEQLARELSIPKSYLAKILQSLARNNILKSHRGAQGGFTIPGDLSKITVYDVILAAEGRLPVVFDCTLYQNTCPNGAIGTCAISPFLLRFQEKIDIFLNDLTLEDLFEEREEGQIS